MPFSNPKKGNMLDQNDVLQQQNQIHLLDDKICASIYIKHQALLIKLPDKQIGVVKTPSVFF